MAYLGELIDKPALDQPATLPNGDDVHNFLYVEDAARAVVLASQTDDTSSIALNVPGEDERVTDAVAIVRELLPDAEIEVQAGSRGDASGFELETTEKEIGYRPQVPLREGLRRSINALRAKNGLPEV